MIAASFSARNRLASYQRHLFLHRSAVGAPLSFRTQAQRLIATTKGFFAHLAAEGTTPYDLAAGIVLPKAEHRLPEGVLSAEEAEAVLAVPDTTTVLGLRDRAMLELFYSSAIRRAELIALRVHDVDFARRTLFVRQGEGGRDRHVPVGSLTSSARNAERLSPIRPSVSEASGAAHAAAAPPSRPDAHLTRQVSKRRSPSSQQRTTERAAQKAFLGFAAGSPMAVLISSGSDRSGEKPWSAA